MRSDFERFKRERDTRKIGIEDYIDTAEHV